MGGNQTIFHTVLATVHVFVSSCDELLYSLLLSVCFLPDRDRSTSRSC